MFARIKTRVNKDGTVREYLQIVANRRVDGKIRQRVLYTLGRLDELRIRFIHGTGRPATRCGGLTRFELT